MVGIVAEATAAPSRVRPVVRRPHLAPSSQPLVSGEHDAPCFDIDVVDRTSTAFTSCLAATMRRSPRDANCWGQRVGSRERDGCERAVLFDHDTVVDLGVLHPWHRSSRAFALNDLGRVVGISRHGLHEHAFVWQGGRMSGLGGLRDPRHAGSRRPALSSVRGTLQSSRACDINNRGLVVGRAATEDRVFGFLWLQGRGLLDLSDLVAHASRNHAWRIVEARHVDDHDRILATAVCDGRWHDVLLIPRR
jgi:probable HAF family extracellular repeat protein